VYDKLYKESEMKIDLAVMKQRMRIQKGQSRKKTIVEERLEVIEEKVIYDFNLKKDCNCHDKPVTEITNKGVSYEDRAGVSKEKLRGKFITTMNQMLPQTSKILKYANEPMAY